MVQRFEHVYKTTVAQASRPSLAGINRSSPLHAVSPSLLATLFYSLGWIANAKSFLSCVHT